MLKYIFGFSAISIILFLAIHFQNKTILPCEAYSVSQFLYAPDNAKKINNSYVSDVSEQHVPWKYFISQYHPKECKTFVESTLGRLKVSGYELPQGLCFPLEASRNYFYYDIFFPLAKVLDFFAAYDLSYHLSLIAIFSAFLFLFVQFTEVTWAAVFAALGALSYPVARDLLSDGLSQTIPLLMTSLALSRIWLKSKDLKVYALSLLTLLLASTRSSLQSLAFCLLMFAAFNLVWNWEHFKNLHKKELLNIAVSLSLVGFLGFIYHIPALHLLFANKDVYLNAGEIPFQIRFIRRILAAIASWGHFVFGDIIFGFDTIDWAKSIGQMGARDYFSYDSMPFFISPGIGLLVVSILLASLFNKTTPKTRAGLKIFFFSLAIDFLMFELPTYRLLYFRIHQWWMTLSILMFLIYFVEDLTWRPFLKWIAGFSFGFLFCAGLAVQKYQPALVKRLGYTGNLGYEPGYWNFKITSWISRAFFQDYYSLLFVLFAASFLYLLANHRRTALFLVSIFAGYALNVYHYNFPQPQKACYDLISEMRARQKPFASPVRRSIPDNIKLMANLPPNGLYESLQADVEILSPANPE